MVLRRAALLLGCCLLGACASTNAPAPTPWRPKPWRRTPMSAGLKSENIPPELRGAIAEAERVGRLLYQLDHMADLGTAFLATSISDAENRELAGSITVPDPGAPGQQPGSFVSVFLTKRTPTRVAFRVHLAEGRPPRLEKVAPPAPVVDTLLFQFRARETALAGIPKWNAAMKAFVLPGQIVGEPGSLVVYLVRKEPHPTELATGMHYRALVSPDGATLRKVEPLSDVSSLRRGVDMEGDIPVISNFRLGHPSEIDVLASLTHENLELGVVTARVQWFLFGGTIRADTRPPESGFVAAVQDGLRGLAASNGMPESELPAELH